MDFATGTHSVMIEAIRESSHIALSEWLTNLYRLMTTSARRLVIGHEMVMIDITIWM